MAETTRNRGTVNVANAVKTDSYAINGTCQTVGQALEKFFGGDVPSGVVVRYNNEPIPAENFDTPVSPGSVILALSGETASKGFRGAAS